MATLSSQLVLTLRDRVTGPSRGVGRALDRMTRDVRGFQSAQLATAGVVGGGLRNLALLAGGYLGLGLGVGGAVRSAMDFETAMADVSKISGLTGARLDAMATTITDLSNTTPITRTELARLVSLGSQFGVAADYLDEFALTASKASVAFDMTAEDTAEGLSVMMNAFRLEVGDLERLTDQINYTADRVGGSESSLMDFLARTGPTAAGFGIEAEALLAYGGGLQAMGISAERAATGMNAVMVKLSGLSEEKGAMEMLDAIGGEGYSARLQRQFYSAPVEAMNSLFETTKKMGAEQRAGFFNEFFGLEYGDDASAIVAAFDKIMEAQANLADETKYLGGVQSAYDIFSETTANRLKVLGNNVTNLGAAFGAKLLPPLVAFSDELVSRLGSLDESVSVFDRIGAATSGFFDGFGDALGLSKGAMTDWLWNGWNLVFGDPANFEGDTDALTRLFLDMREWGAWIGEGAKSLMEMADSIGQFLGAEPGAAGEMLQTIATGALALAGVGLILTTAGKGIGVLARGLFLLSGASALLGGARGIASIFGAIAGANALAAGAGAAAAGGDRNRPPGRGRLGAIGAALGTIPAWELGRAMWFGEGSQVDPGIGRQVGQDTAARIAAERRAEGLRASTLQSLQPRRESFMELQMLREQADEANGSAAQLNTTLGETGQVTGEVGQALTEVGDLTVAPIVDSSSIREAASAARQLRAYLDGINIAPRAVGPGTSDPNYIGPRARGGPIWPGTALVGEEGPELVSFGARGHVLDARRTRSLAASRSSQAAPITLNMGGITINGGGHLSPDDVSRAIARDVGLALRSHYSDAI